MNFIKMAFVAGSLTVCVKALAEMPIAQPPSLAVRMSCKAADGRTLVIVLIPSTLDGKYNMEGHIFISGGSATGDVPVKARFFSGPDSNVPSLSGEGFVISHGIGGAVIPGFRFEQVVLYTKLNTTKIPVYQIRQAQSVYKCRPLQN